MSQSEMAPHAAERPAGHDKAASWSLTAARMMEQLERGLERASDWLNPILVKEARQAMKSRQFTITFTLLLIFGVGWSILGISLMMPGVYYAPSGQSMLVGYYLILAVPMLLTIPFMAYRSLAGELEDGTFELLSITNLSARQIVTGKLGSAIVQMLVYYSAIAPCIAFTYLLRGVDVISIGFILVGTFSSSIMLSIVGLLFASLTRNRHWQLLLMIVFGLALIGGGLTWVSFTMAAFIGGPTPPYESTEFWFGVGVYAATYLSYFVLILFAAEGLNNFPSENRSTKIRYAILAQMAVFAGWIAYPLMMWPDDEVYFVVISLVAAHFYFYGALMTGETAQLSPRAKRSLPRTLLGRMFLTLLNPGSGTGYAFCVICMMAVALILGGIVTYTPIQRWGTFTSTSVYHTLLLSWGYVAFYLGIGRWLIKPLRRFAPHGFVLPLLIHVLILLATAAVPVFASAYWNDFKPIEYSTLQITNWYWSLWEAAERGLDLHIHVVYLVPLAGLLVFLLTLYESASEFQYVRHALPQRVQQDEQQRSHAQIESTHPAQLGVEEGTG